MGRQQSDQFRNVWNQTLNESHACTNAFKTTTYQYIIQTSNWDRTQFYQCCIALMLLTEGAEYSNQSPIAKLECGGE